MFLAKIHVMPKASILDPQGQAVHDTLRKLGHREVKKLRIGRYIELHLNIKEQEEAEKKSKRFL